MVAAAVREGAQGVLLDIEVRPGAAQTRIEGIREGRSAIRIDVAARPERGAANRELCKFLRGLVGRRSDVSVLRGATSRRKTVLVRGASRDAVLAALEAAPR
jgi:uncharacterized protein (TIGR00251 family)